MDPEPLWKILRDPFYGSLYHQYGFNFIQEAGFFFDTAIINFALEDSLDLLCTPLAFLKHGLSNPCILLCTGSLSPIHDGHLEMMEKAKEAVEKTGYQVMGGYFSPGHDEYIRAKTREDWIPIYQRIALIQEKIKVRPWIQCDPWEGVFNQVAVNFTDVIYRLELYLEKHLEQEIPVFYVCGSDNARFTKTFTHEGHCVVVNRPSYSEQYLKYLVNNPDPKRIIFCDANNDSSSTAVRRSKRIVTPEKRTLQLRISRRNPLEAWVRKHLEIRFTSIQDNYIEDQQNLFKSVYNKIISLDSELEIEGAERLQISRLYDLFGSHLLGYTNRPGSEPLVNQITSIPKGKYRLFDDDIHTGNTVKYVTKFLATHGIEIDDAVSLNIPGAKHTEVLDARDFLFGVSDNAGLVIKFKEWEPRIPYLYPYVCPYIRASIHDPLEFSIEMWAYNQKVHLVSQLKLKDVPYLQNLYYYLGFSADSHLHDICKWHHDMLKTYSQID